MRNKVRISFNGIPGMTILLLVFCLSFPLTSFAAPEAVDFSGKWALDAAKSKLGEGGFGASKNMTVTQQGNNLSVERTNTGRNGQEMTFTGKYTLDGKKSENTMGRGTSSSVATWSADGQSLTITTTSSFERNGQKTEMKSVEVWKLSNGGKTLTIDSTGTTPRGERKLTLVYNKQ